MHVVGVVNVQIESGTAGQVRLVHPIAHAIARPAGPAVEGKAQEAPTAPLACELFQRLILRPESDALTDLHLDAGLFGGRREGNRFLRSGGERLFAKNVFSRRNRLAHIARVELRRHAHVDDVDCDGAQRLVDIRIDWDGQAQPLRLFFGRVDILIDDGGQRRLREGRIHLCVQLAHEAESGNKYFLHS